MNLVVLPISGNDGTFYKIRTSINKTAKIAEQNGQLAQKRLCFPNLKTSVYTVQFLTAWCCSFAPVTLALALGRLITELEKLTMSKFEYSDFYKFIASVGITLIALSVFVPWLFLKEPFDLLQRQDEIKLFTPLAQSIIQSRQSTVQTILNLTPAFSIVTFILGLCALGIGGVMWFLKTQKILDKLNELNVKVLENQLGVSSPEEAKVRREEEIKAQYESDEEGKVVSKLKEGEPLAPSRISELAEVASRIERRITGLLVTCSAQTHTILHERRLGPVVIDIVMASKTRLHTDYIIEVKYIRTGFKYNWLRDNALKTVYANQVYQQETNRPSVPVLFIVGADSTALPSDVEKQRSLSRIESELDKLDSKALVVMVTEAELYNTDGMNLMSLLKL